MGQNAKWTFMVYMAGENSLSDAGDEDLADMRKVGSTSDVNIVAEFDNEGDRGTSRYFVKRNSNDIVEDLGETDSGDPQVLRDFIDWSIDNYPAERYALVLWSHGTGWEPKEIDRIAKEVNAAQYDVRQAGALSASQLHRAFFNSTLKKILSEDSPYNRYVCVDNGSGQSLDMVELGNVLASARNKIGQPLDILGMDACLMSNLEVAYQVEPFARYMVASEETEPNQGWPFDMVIGKLTGNADRLTPELTKGIVESYIDAYKKWNQNNVTLTALDLSKVKEAGKKLDYLASALVDHMPEAGDDIWNAQKTSRRFHNQWDIAHFSKELQKITKDSTVVQAAAEVQEVLKAGTENFVIAESHLGTHYDPCCGVSVYLVQPPQSISPYFAELAFSKDTHWLSMLQAYHAPSS